MRVDRWPPMIGVIGFDGGTRPAVALALPPPDLEPGAEEIIGGGDQPTGACCVDGVCTILSRADCIDGGGNYLGDGTTCDGIDCTQGACCFCDSCDDTLTFEECRDSGGVWGTGKTCESNPCCSGNCVILCKCGFTEFNTPSDPPKYYLHRTVVTTGTSSHEITVDCALGASSNYQETRTSDFNSDDCSFSETTEGHHDSTDCNGSHCSDSTFTTSCVRSFCAVGCSDVIVETPTTFTLTTTCDSPSVCHSVTTLVRTLSVEYTTAMLISNTLALLGDCPEGCEARYTLSADESCCTASCVAI